MLLHTAACLPSFSNRDANVNVIGLPRVRRRGFLRIRLVALLKRLRTVQHMDIPPRTDHTFWRRLMVEKQGLKRQEFPKGEMRIKIKITSSRRSYQASR